MYLGCSAILLIETNPFSASQVVPVLLHSGDVLVMMAESRFALHSVPITLKSSFDGTDMMDFVHTKDDEFVLKYLKQGRININTRQVDN